MSVLVALTRINQSTIGVKYLIMNPHQKTKNGSYQSLTDGSFLPSIDIEYPSLYTPHMSMSWYHPCNPMLDRTMTNEGTTPTSKNTPMKTARPIATYSTHTNTIPTMHRIIQNVALSHRSARLWTSDLAIVSPASNPQPQPKHCRIPTRSSKYTQR